MVESWVVESTPSERFPIYTRANVGEVFPDPVAPLTYSFGFLGDDGQVLGTELGFRDAYVRIGAFEHDEFPDDQLVFLGVNGGYCYLNASAMRLFGERSPGLTAADIDAMFFGAQPGIPPYEEQPGDVRPDLEAKVGETFGWALTTESLDEVLADERQMNELRRVRPELAQLTDRELFDRWYGLVETHWRHIFGQHIYITMLATVPVGIITAVCEAVGRPTDALRLMAGVGDVESAAPSMAMWELGRVVAGSPALMAVFDAGLDGLVGRVESASGTGAEAFRSRFAKFLLDYGARGPNEWEQREPTWEVEPELALAAIDRMRLSAAEAAPTGHNRELAEDRVRLVKEIASLVEADPETHGQFLAGCHAATVLMPGRERTKTNAVKFVHELRMMMREYGGRMVERGHWDEIIDFGLLTVSELNETLDDPTANAEVLSSRRADMETLGELQEPFIFIGTPPPLAEYPRRDARSVDLAESGDVLGGIPGCPGVSRGRARVVLDSHDPTALQPGDVLVAPITDPSWTPLFVPAGGIIVDVGAPLSHAIIVSRELGIPCVVSVTDATKRIPDGALVEVNGDTGEVTILDSTPDG